MRNVERFQDSTGLKIVHEGGLKDELPPMPKFLNRLLALPIAEQNQLFAELEERIAANIEQAIEAGSYEVGVETVIADSLAVAGRETLYEHPGTGAATELVEIVRRDKLDPTTAESALAIGAHDPAPDSPPRTGSGGKPRLVVNTRSKRAAVVLPAPSRMFDDGGVQERVRLLRPATRESMARAELEASNWLRADEAHWRTLWDHEIGELPTHRESRLAATRLSATGPRSFSSRDSKGNPAQSPTDCQHDPLRVRSSTVRIPNKNNSHRLDISKRRMPSCWSCERSDGESDETG